MAVFAATSLAAASPANADTTVEVAKQKVDGALFVANQLTQKQGIERYKDLILQKALQELASGNPTFGADKLIADATTIKEAISKAPDEIQQLLSNPSGLVDNAQGFLSQGVNYLTKLGPVEKLANGRWGQALKSAPAVYKALSGAISFLAEPNVDFSTIQSQIQQGLLGAADQASSYVGSLAKQQNVLQSSFDLANGVVGGQPNQTFATAWNALESSVSGCTIECTANQILSGDQTLAQSAALVGIVDPSTDQIKADVLTAAGGIDLSLSQTSTDAAQEFTNLSDATKAATDIALQDDTSQSGAGYSLTDFSNLFATDSSFAGDQTTDASTAETDLSDLEASSDQKTAQGDITLLTSLIGVFRPEQAKQFQALATAGLEAFNAASSLVEGIAAAANPLDAIDPLSFATSAGSALKALNSVFGVFGPTVSPQEQYDKIILQQVEKTHEELHKLGEVMESRFDRVDEGISLIYKKIDEVEIKLDNISQNLALIRGELKVIDERLSGIQSQIDQLHEQTNFEFKGWDEKGDKIAIKEGLLWKANHKPTNPMPEDKFDEFLEHYEGIATNDAQSVVWEPKSLKAEREAANVKTRLQEKNIDENLDYLAEVVNERYGFHIFQSECVRQGVPVWPCVADPAVWANGAQAYAKLLNEWPEYAIYRSPFSAEQIEGIGLQLKNDLSRISDPVIGARLFGDLEQSYMAHMGGGGDSGLYREINEDERLWGKEAGHPPIEAIYTNVGPSGQFEGQECQIGEAECDTLLKFFPPRRTPPELHLAPVTNATRCNNQSGALTLSAEIGHILTYYREYEIAENLRLGHTFACWSAAWGPKRTNTECSLLGPPEECRLITLTFQVRFGTAAASEPVATFSVRDDIHVRELFGREFISKAEIEGSPEVFATKWWSTPPPGNGIPISDYEVDDPPHKEFSDQAVSAKIASSQDSWAAAMYRHVRDGLRSGSGNLAEAGAAATGDVELMKAFAQLGFPRGYAGDERLRDLLQGPEIVLDGESAANDWNAKAQAVEHLGATPTRPVPEAEAANGNSKEALFRRLSEFASPRSTPAETDSVISEGLGKIALANDLTYDYGGEAENAPPALDQQQTASTTSFSFYSQGSPTPAYRQAQTFTAGKTGQLSEVDLGLESAGSIKVELRATENGQPTGPVLAETGVDASAVGLKANTPLVSPGVATVPVVFSKAPRVTAGRSYAIIVSVPEEDASTSWGASTGTYDRGAAFRGGADPAEPLEPLTENGAPVEFAFSTLVSTPKCAFAIGGGEFGKPHEAHRLTILNELDTDMKGRESLRVSYETGKVRFKLLKATKASCEGAEGERIFEGEGAAKRGGTIKYALSERGSGKYFFEATLFNPEGKPVLAEPIRSGELHGFKSAVERIK